MDHPPSASLTHCYAAYGIYRERAGNLVSEPERRELRQHLALHPGIPSPPASPSNTAPFRTGNKAADLPDAAVRAYLTAIDRNPAAVDEALRG